MGSLRTFGYLGSKSLKHILLNNNAHESVGGQQTSAFGIDFKNLVKSLGYKKYFKISHKKKIRPTLKKFLKSKGPSFLEVITKLESSKNLIRPSNLIKIKKNFMK